jgi:hypothetical protein
MAFPLSRPFPCAPFQTISGYLLTRPWSESHLEMELRCRYRCFSKRLFGLPRLPNGNTHPAAQLHTSTTGRSARPRWTLGFEREERSGPGPDAGRLRCRRALRRASAHPPRPRKATPSLIACPGPPALVWRLLAGRVVLHPGSGMRKGSHERFFHSPPPSSTGAEQCHPCMVGGWAEIALPRLPRDRLLISKTGPMSGRGIAETKCQDFAATETALAPPWPRRVIDRLILAGPSVRTRTAGQQGPSAWRPATTCRRRPSQIQCVPKPERPPNVDLPSLPIRTPSTMPLLPQQTRSPIITTIRPGDLEPWHMSTSSSRRAVLHPPIWVDGKLSKASLVVPDQRLHLFLHFKESPRLTPAVSPRRVALGMAPPERNRSLVQHKVDIPCLASL